MRSRLFIELFCLLAVLLMGLVMGFAMAYFLHYPLPPQPTPTPERNNPIQVGLILQPSRLLRNAARPQWALSVHSGQGNVHKFRHLRLVRANGLR